MKGRGTSFTKARPRRGRKVFVSIAPELSGSASRREVEDPDDPSPAHQVHPEADEENAHEPVRRRFRLSGLVAVAVLFLGVVVTVSIASSSAHNAAERSLASFKTQSEELAAVLKLEVQHEEELVVSAGAFFSTNPSATPSQFSKWTADEQTFARYPEIMGFGRAVETPSAAAAGEMAPPCHLADEIARVLLFKISPNLNFCTGSLGKAMYAARDSGQAVYLPIRQGHVILLSIFTPSYGNGTNPRTVAERRANFIGWVGTAIEPSVLLDEALHAHPILGVTFSYRPMGGPSGSVPSTGTIIGTSSVSVSAGKTHERHAATVSTNLHNGWVVTTYGNVVPDAIGAAGGSSAQLLYGLLLSAIVAALLFLLATSRLRALRLVEQRTGELRHLALHDALTDLPNRALVADRADQLIRRNRRNGTLASTLYLDLDHFKTINDTLGHDVGDQLLRSVADRLRSTLRDSDTVGRIGGDEFVVLLDGANPVVPHLVAERILDVMREPFELDGAATEVSMTISIGVATGDRPNAQDLLRDADLALYEAKSGGRNRYEVFHKDMDSEILRRYEIELGLRSAIQHDDLRLVYQPICSLGDMSVIGFEALLRWRHPTLGDIQPAEFIPILESSGQIDEAGRFVLNEACRQAARWRERQPGLIVSVNVSVRQLDRDRIVRDVEEALTASNLEPDALMIEVTETALSRNVDSTVERLVRLKALGVRIAIDDFGTGYSNLSYIRRFPVNCLKIDSSFTDSIGKSAEADVLFHTLVQLAKDLNLLTIAEGVETDAQMFRLHDEQVAQAQGFLLAYPAEAHVIEREYLEGTPVREFPATS